MLLLDCPHCGRPELIGPRRLRTVHNTTSGPVGAVACTKGHELLYDFRRRTTVSVANLLG